MSGSSSVILLEGGDDDEILSSSTTARLWKSAFTRRGGQQFLDICLLKKAYMKTLEDMVDEEQNKEIITSLLETLVDQTVADLEDHDGDELGLASRITKRSVNLESDVQKLKRLRGDSVTGLLSV